MEPAKPSLPAPAQWTSEGTNDVRVMGRCPAFFPPRASGEGAVLQFVVREALRLAFRFTVTGMDEMRAGRLNAAPCAEQPRQR